MLGWCRAWLLKSIIFCIYARNCKMKPKYQIQIQIQIGFIFSSFSLKNDWHKWASDQFLKKWMHQRVAWKIIPQRFSFWCVKKSKWSVQTHSTLLTFGGSDSCATKVKELWKMRQKSNYPLLSVLRLGKRKFLNIRKAFISPEYFDLRNICQGKILGNTYFQWQIYGTKFNAYPLLANYFSVLKLCVTESKEWPHIGCLINFHYFTILKKSELNYTTVIPK